MTEEKEKMELETAALIRALLKAWRWIALGAVMGAGLVMMITVLFVGPAYQSDVMFRVTNRAQAEELITPEDVSASRDLVESCAVIVHTRAFLKEAAARAGVDITARELGKMVTAEAVNETEFLRVTVTSESPEEAARIAEAIGGVLPEQAAMVLEGAGAALVDAAVFSAEPCGPNYVSIGMIGLLLGLLVSCGAVTARELWKRLAGKAEQ